MIISIYVRLYPTQEVQEDLFGMGQPQVLLVDAQADRDALDRALG